ncbi:MAG: tetratricopeptide repeat protein [Candidatus Polarisedimenticolia bacterium]
MLLAAPTALFSQQQPLTLLPGPAVQASASAGSVATLPDTEEIRARIHQLWFARKEAMEASDNVLAQTRVEELRAYLLQEGITADREVARGFAYEGYENLREGNYERAREAFHLAGTFDPYLPQAPLGYAWSLLRSGQSVVTFVNEYARGVRLAWAQSLTDELEMTNLIVAAAAAVLFGAIMFSLVVVARIQVRVRHDLVETLRRVFPLPMARLGAWVIFLLPLLTWTGGIWIVLFWLALCFRYMRLAEKAVATAVFLMMGLSPLAMNRLLDQFEASTNPEVRVAVEAMQAGYNPELIRRLGEVVRAHDESPELHLLLGLSYASGDQLGEAFDEYQRVLQVTPSNAAALVNVGNIYYRLGEPAQAVAHYKQAVQVQPNLAAAYWNLYLAQTDVLHFDEAEASLARARELDADGVGRMLASKKGGGQEILLEQPADLARIKHELRTRLSGGEQAKALTSPVTVASGVALGLSLILSLWGRRAEACERCGRAFCAHCALNPAQSLLCAGCIALFKKKDGIRADVRSQEMARLARRDRLTTWVRRALSAILPGSGHILAGRIGIGLPSLMLWSAAVMFLLSRERLLMAPRVPVTDLPAPSVIGAAVLMAGLWILCNLSSYARHRLALETAHGA